MNLKAPLGIAILLASVAAYSTARAEGRDEHHEEHAAPPQQHAPRQPPPKFEAHPAGVHPRGPTVRSHPVRVLAPRVIVHGNGHEWRHWDHPEFVRPSYYWDWNAIHQVSCVAEDSYGDQYPVTENWSAGWGLDNMTNVEDDAIDRCYSESGSDSSCYLATCSHF